MNRFINSDKERVENLIKFVQMDLTEQQKFVIGLKPHRKIDLFIDFFNFTRYTL